jgi:hypothetical protein
MARKAKEPTTVTLMRETLRRSTEPLDIATIHDRVQTRAGKRKVPRATILAHIYRKREEFKRVGRGKYRIATAKKTKAAKQAAA